MKYTGLLIFGFVILFAKVESLDAQTKTVTFSGPKVARQFNPEFKGKPEEEIEALEHKLSDAWLSADVAILSELHSDDVLVKEIVGNKAQFIDLLTTPHFRQKLISIEKSEMRIRIYGDTAVVAGRQVMNLRNPDGFSTTTAPFMNVWKRMKDGKWRCVAVA